LPCRHNPTPWLSADDQHAAEHFLAAARVSREGITLWPVN
jgi:hypothetical protein